MKNKVHIMLKNMGATSTIHVDVLWWWNIVKKENLTPHTWLLHKSPVWGRVVKISLSSIHTKGNLGLKRKKSIIIYIYEWKKKKREGAFSFSWPLLPLRPMVYAHYMCVWPSVVVLPELDHVQSNHRCSNLEHSSTYVAGKNNSGTQK